MRQSILLTLMEAASVPVTVTGPLEPRSSLESCLAKRKKQTAWANRLFPTYLGRGNTMSGLSKRKTERGNWFLKRKGKQRAATETQAAPRRRTRDVYSQPFGIFHVGGKKWNCGGFHWGRQEKRPSCSQQLPRRVGCCG